MKQNIFISSLSISLTVLLFFSTNAADNTTISNSIQYYRRLSNDVFPDNDKSYTFVNIANHYGYDAEEHQVETDDGYLIILHRIKLKNHRPGKPVVMLLHPFLGASDVWLYRGPEYDIPYMLLDEGYDVWAMNTRGNVYSRRHKTLSTRQPKFWEFSWHETAVYDLPASIDVALTSTGQRHLSLIGLSMGGTVELVFLSQRPDYKSKVNVAVAWSPLAILKHDFPGLVPKLTFMYGDQVEAIMRALNTYELFPRLRKEIRDFVKYVYRSCFIDSGNKHCIKTVQDLFGILEVNHINADLLDKIIRLYPAGTSLQTISHYIQIIKTRRFRPYDYGTARNYIKYKSAKPPDYPLSKIETPLVIYYGPRDHVATKKDMEYLASIIPSSILREVSDPDFGHTDFVVMNKSKELVYKDVIKILNHYTYHTVS